MTSEQKWHSVGFLCVIFAFCCQIAISWLLLGKIQLCFFRLFSGLPCPGCGLTHAGIALLRGDIVQSLRYHLLFIPVVVCLTYCFYQKFLSPQKAITHARFLIVFLIIDVGYFVLRVVTSFPDGPYPMIYDPQSLAPLIFRAIRNIF